MFSVSPAIDAKALEQIFRHKVLKMLLAKGKITQDHCGYEEGLEKSVPAKIIDG
ncbi:MAG: hypothetical protein KQI78_11610 [Deltaproteobacteria bacterium]|nr:hypothetical protein [Deltaproteobacteria bacterium]